MLKAKLDATLTALCLAALCACDTGNQEPVFDAAQRRDAETLQDAERPVDGSPHDAAEASGSFDGGTDAQDGAASVPPPGRRKEICGTTTSFPMPLPAQRTAQPVGSATFGFTEGPVWLAGPGVLLFSDMDFAVNPAPLGPPGRIRRLTPPTSFDVFVDAASSNGLALAHDGTLLAATHDTQALSRFDLATGARTNLPLLALGKHLNSPNDLTVRSDGTVFLTDPDWQLPPRSSETMRTGVYRVSAPLSSSANEAVLVEGTLTKPNGIALSPDEQTLYVGSSGNEIWKYSVAADGGLGARSKFAETGASDGMTVDCAGNLYVASGKIEVFAPDGSKHGDIEVGESPTNAAFGGEDRKTLYITAGSRLYAIKLNVPGYPY